MEKKIGIFDSGVGGLTVFKELKKLCNTEKYLYIGDTQNLPYGTKTKEELLNITTKIFNYFQKQDVKAIVMACNTTSAVTWQELQTKYNIPIYPISQTVCKYLNTQNFNRIGVFATLATVNSKVYQNNLNAQSCAIAPIEWVNIVETNSYKENTSQEFIKKYAQEMQKFKPQKIILGCTHYPYLIDELTKYFDKDILLNPAPIFAKAILQDLQSKNLLSNSPTQIEDEFVVTSSPQQFIVNAERFYKIKKLPKLIEF